MLNVIHHLIEEHCIRILSLSSIEVNYCIILSPSSTLLLN